MTVADYASFIVPVIAAFAAIVTSWLTVRAGRKKASAEATQTLTDIAMGLVTPLKQQIDELQEELASLED